jgi:transcriptional regulator with XRE-family HTH domain
MRMVGKYRQLSEFVAEVMDDKKLSNKQVSERSKLRGEGISSTSVWNIRNNTYSDIGMETLKALARGLSAPPSEIFRRALADVLNDENGLTALDDVALKDLLHRIEKLPDPHKDAMNPIIDMVGRELDYREKLAAKEARKKSHR